MLSSGDGGLYEGIFVSQNALTSNLFFWFLTSGQQRKQSKSTSNQVKAEKKRLFFISEATLHALKNALHRPQEIPAFYHSLCREQLSQLVSKEQLSIPLHTQTQTMSVPCNSTQPPTSTLTSKFAEESEVPVRLRRLRLVSTTRARTEGRARTPMRMLLATLVTVTSLDL